MNLIGVFHTIRFLFSTPSAPTPENGPTHSNNLSAEAGELVECAWSFCGVGA